MFYKYSIVIKASSILRVTSNSLQICYILSKISGGGSISGVSSPPCPTEKNDATASNFIISVLIVFTSLLLCFRRFNMAEPEGETHSDSESGSNGDLDDFEVDPALDRVSN